MASSPNSRNNKMQSLNSKLSDQMLHFSEPSLDYDLGSDFLKKIQKNLKELSDKLADYCTLTAHHSPSIEELSDHLTTHAGNLLVYADDEDGLSVGDELLPFMTACIDIANLLEIQIDPLSVTGATQALCAINDKELLEILYTHNPESIVNKKVALYQHTYFHKSFNTLKAIRAKNVPTFLSEVHENPFDFHKNINAITPMHVAYDYLLESDLRVVVNKIKTSEEAELLINLRDISPLDALASCDNEHAKQLFLAMIP